MDDDLMTLPPLNLTPNEMKTELFAGIYHLEKINQEFRQILLWPKKKRTVWLNKNKNNLDQLMAQYFERSQLALQGIEGDQQTVQLSVEYVTHLRDVMNVVHSIFYGGNTLKA